MNITYYKARIKRIKKWYKEGKYSKRKTDNWIIGCQKMIKKLKENKKKTTRIKNAK